MVSSISNMLTILKNRIGGMQVEARAGVKPLKLPSRGRLMIGLCALQSDGVKGRFRENPPKSWGFALRDRRPAVGLCSPRHVILLLGWMDERTVGEVSNWNSSI